MEAGEANREKIWYNALTTTTNSSYKTLEQSYQKNNSWQKAAQKNGAITEKDALKKWDQLQQLGISVILAKENNFPAHLREIPYPPHGLYVKGNSKDLMDAQKTIAIVGTRKATEHGKSIAQEISRDLAAHGLVIVSGLAAGIDTAAHEAALSAGGKTVAIVGHGLDIVYPATNKSLAKKIAQNGAIVSEYPLGTVPLPYRFLERNRIVSGLSRAIVVIEAPEKSGARATARFALEQNREIFVVPGAVNNPNYKGSHKLIREGATLVENAADILEILGIEEAGVAQKENYGAVAAKNEEERAILEELKKAGEPLSLDKIQELSKLSIQVVGRVVTFLIIKHAVKETERGIILL